MLGAPLAFILSYDQTLLNVVSFVNERFLRQSFRVSFTVPFGTTHYDAQLFLELISFRKRLASIYLNMANEQYLEYMFRYFMYRGYLLPHLKFHLLVGGMLRSGLMYFPSAIDTSRKRAEIYMEKRFKVKRFCIFYKFFTSFLTLKTENIYSFLY